MLYKRRSHNIKRYGSAHELAFSVRRSTWTLCTGFRWEDIILVNDSTSEDAIQEYAALRVLPDGKVVQVESLTVGWYESDDALAQCLTWLHEGKDAGGGDAPMVFGEYTAPPHPEGSCPRCA